MRKFYPYDWYFHDQNKNSWHVYATGYKKRGQNYTLTPKGKQYEQEFHWQCGVEQNDNCIFECNLITREPHIAMLPILMAWRRQMDELLQQVVLNPPKRSEPPEKTSKDIVLSYWESYKKEVGVKDTKGRVWGIPDDVGTHGIKLLEFIKNNPDL